MTDDMAKNSTLTPAQLTSLLAKHDASLVADLLKQVDAAAAIEKKGTNVELRKAAHRKNLKENNSIELTKVAEAQDVILPHGAEIAAKSDAIMDRGFTEDEAAMAMDMAGNCT